jgi:hypothetical protein
MACFAGIGADVFGLKGLSVVIVILAFGLWSVGLMASSIIVAVKHLEHVKVRKIVDGQDKVFVTLKLGSFWYTIDVPEETKAD